MHKICLISLFIFLIGGCRSNHDKPNFVFILVDDLGWTDLGCYGSTFYDTPNLDNLAEQGVRFTDAYAACPVCSPTRASILTGKYPSRINITDWIKGDDPKNRPLAGPTDSHELPLEEFTIAEALKERGYSTFFAGKWHLGDKGYYPEDQGFDYNFGGHHMGQPPGGYYSPYNNPKLSDGPDGEYLTDRLASESIEFLKNNKNRPFLLYLSLYTVHTPIEANLAKIEQYNKKRDDLGEKGQPVVSKEHSSVTVLNQVNPAYGSMVASMDENVGRIMNYLRETGLEKNTYIIFTSDNGGLTTQRGDRISPTSVKPLRAGKGWCYEGGIRVPLIVTGPGIKKGESDYPVISTDFYPTILDLAGLKQIPGQHTDGVSFYPLIEGQRPLREAIFWHYPHYHSSGWTPGAAVRKGDWKLIEFYETGITELYNLKDDPGETEDLSVKNPEVTEELKRLLKAMQSETGARFPVKNPEYTAE